MTTEQYKAKLEEWKKAREAATQEEWYAVKRTKHSTSYQFYEPNENNKNTITAIAPDSGNYKEICLIEKDAFIALSANHWTELIDAHIKAIEALEKIGHDLTVTCQADEAEKECFDVAQAALAEIYKLRGEK